MNTPNDLLIQFLHHFQELCTEEVDPLKTFDDIMNKRAMVREAFRDYDASTKQSPAKKNRLDLGIKCVNCLYANKFGNADLLVINCHRYPSAIAKDNNDWCGEFRHEDRFSMTNQP